MRPGPYNAPHINDRLQWWLHSIGQNFTDIKKLISAPIAPLRGDCLEEKTRYVMTLLRHHLWISFYSSALTPQWALYERFDMNVYAGKIRQAAQDSLCTVKAPWWPCLGVLYAMMSLADKDPSPVHQFYPGILQDSPFYDPLHKLMLWSLIRVRQVLWAYSCCFQSPWDDHCACSTYSNKACSRPAYFWSSMDRVKNTPVLFGFDGNGSKWNPLLCLKIH